MAMPREIRERWKSFSTTVLSGASPQVLQVAEWSFLAGATAHAATVRDMADKSLESFDRTGIAMSRLAENLQSPVGE